MRLLEKHRDDPDLMAECTEWLPAVQGGLARRLSGIAEEIRRLGKKKLLLLTPELALLEELAKDSGGIEEIYLEIASETDGRARRESAKTSLTAFPSVFWRNSGFRRISGRIMP